MTNDGGAGTMSIHTMTTAGLSIAPVPACDRCHRQDRHGLSGWLGLSLCGICMLVAKARRTVSS